MTLRLLSVLLALLAVAGCETFAEPDPSDHDPVLVVTARFEAGVPWSVQVGRTVALNDPAADYGQGVAGATVTVTADDGAVLVLPAVEGGPFRRGLYGATPVDYTGQLPLDAPRFEDGPAPEAGRAYTVRVTAPGYRPVVARSRAPRPAEIAASVVDGWERSETGGGEGDVFVSYEGARLSVQLSEVEPGVQVQLSFVSVEEAASGEGGLVGQWLTFFTGAPVMREATFLADIQDGARRRLSGAFLDLVALAASSEMGPSATRPFEVLVERPGSETIRAEAVTASEEHYLAERSAARARAAEENPFAEPVAAYSNVEGGAGVFAGSSRRWVEVRRP